MATKITRKTAEASSLDTSEIAKQEVASLTDREKGPDHLLAV